jgi:hypothetical protein
MKILASNTPKGFVVKYWRNSEDEPADAVAASIVGNEMRGSDGVLAIKRASNHTMTATFQHVQTSTYVATGEVTRRVEIRSERFKKFPPSTSTQE